MGQVEGAGFGRIQQLIANYYPLSHYRSTTEYVETVCWVTKGLGGFIRRRPTLQKLGKAAGGGWTVENHPIWWVEEAPKQAPNQPNAHAGLKPRW